MKKVIIALLVIASLFTFVSCKDDVTYDKWAKMEPLDTDSEEAKVFAIAFSLIDYALENNHSSVDTYKETTTIHFDDQDATYPKSGTIVMTDDFEKVSYKFNGSFKYEEEGSPFTKCEFVVKNSELCDTNGETLDNESQAFDRAFAIMSFLTAMESDDNPITNVEASAEFSMEDLDIAIPTTDITVMAIKCTDICAGYNHKFSLEFDPFNMIRYQAQDMKMEITYKTDSSAKKTLKATVSMAMSTAGRITTVSFGGKTYGLNLN